MSILKKALFDEYDGFADGRIKKLTTGSIFAVDGRSRTDYGSNGKLYGTFCAILVEIKSELEVVVSMTGNIPIGPEVRSWMAKFGPILTTEAERRIVFVITKGQEAILEELAKAIRVIVAPGRRYDTSSYKHACPRTADSLLRLRKVLAAAWNS